MLLEITEKNLNEIPENIFNYIKLNVETYFRKEFTVNIPIDYDDIIEFISDSASPDEINETIDDDYVNKNYEILFDKFKLKFRSSQYRKDGGLCDSENNNYFIFKIF